MLTSAHLFAICPHARPVLWAELTRQVADSGQQHAEGPAPVDQVTGRQVVVMVCTCGRATCPGGEPDIAPGQGAGNAGPFMPMSGPRYQLADPGVVPRRSATTAGGRVKPTVTPLPRRRRGKPRLQATLWLEGEIGKLADMNDYDQLYQEWLRRYTAEVGQAPMDTWRSFHNTAAACIRRILSR